MPDPVVEALREIARVTRGQVDLAGRMLRWVESGRGTTTVVLVAGRNDTALSWGPVLAALAGRVHAVAYDRAGLGDSDPDVKIPSAERSVADLFRLINVVSGGPCVVAGHSYGGLLALVLAAYHPGSVAGLVLVDPVLPGLLGQLPGPVRRGYGMVTRVRPLALSATGLLRPAARRTASHLASAFSDDPRVRDLVIRAYLASADWPHARAARAEGLGIMASEPAIRRALAAPISPGHAAIRTVVLSAAEGRPVKIRRRWTALQADLAAERDGTHIVVAGSGHAVHLHRPALVAEAIVTCAQ
jgi:pimeloyl-ACP methyl ester carboxylesterase